MAFSYISSDKAFDILSSAENSSQKCVFVDCRCGSFGNCGSIRGSLVFPGSENGPLSAAIAESEKLAKNALSELEKSPKTTQKYIFYCQRGVSRSPTAANAFISTINAIAPSIIESKQICVCVIRGGMDSFSDSYGWTPFYQNC